jgi:hypothetical protein
MNPQEFVALAQELSAGATEAHARSAVSRAYYGMFHYTCQFIESLGVSLPRGASAHEKASVCLQHSNDALLTSAGRELNSLRSIRNAADYRLDDARFADHAFASKQLSLAEAAIAAILQSAQQHSPAVRSAIRDYARNIQGLIVQGND